MLSSSRTLAGTLRSFSSRPLTCRRSNQHARTHGDVGHGWLSLSQCGALKLSHPAVAPCKWQAAPQRTPGNGRKCYCLLSVCRPRCLAASRAKRSAGAKPRSVDGRDGCACCVDGNGWALRLPTFQ
jgi:hypothetical protein